MRASIGWVMVAGVLLWGVQSAQGQFFDAYLSDAVGVTGDTVQVVMTLDHQAGDIVEGWNVGVCHDATALELIDVAHGSIFDAYPVDFFDQLDTEPDGWTATVVYALAGGQGLPPGFGYEMYVATYQILATGSELDTTVEFCDALGVSTTLVISGLGVPPTEHNATVAINPAGIFRRGDANNDGMVDIADAVNILNSLFSTGPPLACMNAGDANDDERVDIGDPGLLLDALFGGASVIPAPGPLSCGVDLTPGVLTCAGALCP